MRAAAFDGEGRQNTDGDLVTTATMSQSYSLDYDEESMMFEGEQMFYPTDTSVWIQKTLIIKNCIVLETSKQLSKILNKQWNIGKKKKRLIIFCHENNLISRLLFSFLHQQTITNADKKMTPMIEQFFLSTTKKEYNRIKIKTIEISFYVFSVIMSI